MKRTRLTYCREHCHLTPCTHCELRRLRRDKARLDWMLKTGVFRPTRRELDAAMRSENAAKPRRTK